MNLDGQCFVSLNTLHSAGALRKSDLVSGDRFHLCMVDTTKLHALYTVNIE